MIAILGDGPRALLAGSLRHFAIGRRLDSFSFDIARVMLAVGFAPDTIPSHVHALGRIRPITAMAIPQS